MEAILTKPVRQLKDKIRDLTPRTSQANPRDLLIRINQILNGWANYFKHAVAKHTFKMLANSVWWRIVQWLMVRHRWTWKDVRRWLTTSSGRWNPLTADGIELFDLAPYFAGHPVVMTEWSQLIAHRSEP